MYRVHRTVYIVKRPRTRYAVLFFIFFYHLNFLSPFAVCRADPAIAESAMVVTQHPLATEAALKILKRGGNAADAAIAAQLVLNVVEPQSSGLGGGGFFIYYDHIKRNIVSFDGRETAPASASPEMFLKSGKPIKFSPDRITGGLSVGIPGTPALIQKIYDKVTSSELAFSELVEPAIKLAEEGFPISHSLAAKLAEHADRLKQFPETKKIFFHEEDTPLKEGEILKQPELAKTLRLFSEQSSKIFYQGMIADAMVEAITKSPVLPVEITKEDFKKYAVVERDPVYGSYRGLDIFGVGLPASGTVLILEMLNVLETFNLGELGWDAQALHYLGEAQKLVFYEREQLGDPKFTEIQTSKLISKDYAKELSYQIQEQKTIHSNTAVLEDGKQTTHISIVDRWGNLASWTSTIEAPFGSGIIVPKHGFFLNNELTDFDPEPRDVANHLKPNAAGPDKRPLSSMTPLLIFNHGKPFMVVGSPGGTAIIGTVLNTIVNHVDFGLSCRDSVAKPRLIFRGGKIEMESALYQHPTIRLQLELWGHDIEKVESIGNVQAICFDSSRQEIVGVSDSRGEGSASGY